MSRKEGSVVFFERLFIGNLHYTLHALEDKLKEISIKVVFGVKFKSKVFDLNYCFKVENFEYPLTKIVTHTGSLNCITNFIQNFNGIYCMG